MSELAADTLQQKEITPADAFLQAIFNDLLRVGLLHSKDLSDLVGGSLGDSSGGSFEAVNEHRDRRDEPLSQKTPLGRDRERDRQSIDQRSHKIDKQSQIIVNGGGWIDCRDGSQCGNFAKGICRFRHRNADVLKYYAEKVELQERIVDLMDRENRELNDRIDHYQHALTESENKIRKLRASWHAEK